MTRVSAMAPKAMNTVLFLRGMTAAREVDMGVSELAGSGFAHRDWLDAIPRIIY